MEASRLRLYLVADPDLVDGNLPGIAAAAIDAGVSCVQLRVKRRTDLVFERLGVVLAEICRDRKVMLLVNDRVDIALAVGADGVHLGVDDMSIEAARRVGGSDFVIGYSPDTDDQASAAASRGADYLGVGPVFGTSSKHDAGEAIGLDTLRERIRLSGIPTIGIGGITHQNAAEVVAAGACGVAVMSAILRSSDPVIATRTLDAAVGRGSG